MSSSSGSAIAGIVIEDLWKCVLAKLPYHVLFCVLYMDDSLMTVLSGDC